MLVETRELRVVSCTPEMPGEPKGHESVHVRPDDRGDLGRVPLRDAPGSYALLNAVDEKLKRGLGRVRRALRHDGGVTLGGVHEHYAVIARVLEREAQVLPGAARHALPRGGCFEGADEV